MHADVAVLIFLSAGHPTKVAEVVLLEQTRRLVVLREHRRSDDEFAGVGDSPGQDSTDSTSSAGLRPGHCTLAGIVARSHLEHWESQSDRHLSKI